MLFSLVVAALAASPLVAAHGKIAVLTGDAGGNGTALGIQGGSVPGSGKNSQTETDTTVFKSTNIATNGLGKTEGSGENTVDMVTDTMAASGSTLPQVSGDGSGSISGTFHIVTTDGAGPVKALVDSTGTGAFESATEADVVTQVPGANGNIEPDGTVPKGKFRRWLGKRAANVNQDYPVKVSVPAGTTCTGSAGGQSNVCLLKIANANPAGPFGGVVAFQIAGASSNSTAAAAPAAAPAAAAGSSSSSTEGAGASSEGAGASSEGAEGAGASTNAAGTSAAKKGKAAGIF